MKKIYSDILNKKNILIDLIDRIAQLNLEEKSLEKKDIFNVLEILIPNREEFEEIKEIKRKTFNDIKFNIKTSSIEKIISQNSSLLIESVKRLQSKIFESFEKNKDFDIKNYDIIFFDADKTIWTGTPAHKMSTPFNLISENTIKDSEDNAIQLKDGIREVFIKIRSMGKDIGIISHSENKDLSAEDQPVYELIKMFKLNDLINEKIIIFADFPKSIFIPKGKKVLFVDDDKENLFDVFYNSEASVIDVEDCNFEKVASIEDKVIIEKTTEEDFEECSRVSIESFADKFSEDVVMHEVLRADMNISFKATIGGKIIGCYLLCLGDVFDFEPMFHDKNMKGYSGKKGIEGVALSVLPEYRGLGIGKRLRSCPLDNKEYDYIYGLHYNELDNVKNWENFGRKEIGKNNVFSITFMDLKNEEKKAHITNNWYVESKRNYIPRSERPDKPDDGKEYQLDHVTPLWSGGKNQKRNLQWMEKDKHKKKTQEEGSYEHGGKLHQKQEKSKGKKKYKEYQSNAAKKKIEKEKNDLGEKGFSDLQRQRALSRWYGKKKKSK